jgi:hypothetical protein
MKFEQKGNDNTDPMDRRIIIVTSKEDLEKNGTPQKNKIWSTIKKGASIVNPLIGFALEAGELATSLVITNTSGKQIPHTGYDINVAKTIFTFEPGNPRKNTAYAMIEILPDQYFSLTSFHEKVKQMKLIALQELCANLGAKEINLTHCEIDGKTIDVSGEGTIPTELGMLGLQANVRKGIFKNAETKIGITFPEKNKKIKEYDSPWMKTEHTWQSMKKMRIENHIKEYHAEFNFTDDMGIDAKVAGKLGEIGIGIGGKFTEMKKIHFKYDVIFW